MKEKEGLEFIKTFAHAKGLFSDVFKWAKKRLVLEDEEEFIIALSESLRTEHGLVKEDAQRYAEIVYTLWEACGCSLTSFDRKMSEYKEKILL